MHKFILLFFILFVFQISVYPQALTKDDWVKNYRDLDKAFSNRTLSESEYLYKIDSLTNFLLTSGLDISNDDYMAFLSTFKKISFENDEFSKYRSIYYRFLSNNALTKGDNGEALFYAEKNDEELKKQGIVTFHIPYLKLIIWGESQNYQKVYEQYLELQSEIDKMANGTMNSNSVSKYLQAMQCLQYS